ncbi:MAG: hypothetical protein AAB197_05030, partial [Deltaproteobacteria bacterium]
TENYVNFAIHVTVPPFLVSCYKISPDPSFPKRGTLASPFSPPFFLREQVCNLLHKFCDYFYTNYLGSSYKLEPAKIHSFI